MKEITLKPHHVKERLLIEELKMLPCEGVTQFAMTNRDVYVPLECNYTLIYSYIRIMKGMVVGVVETNEGKLSKKTKFDGWPFRSKNILVYVQDGCVFHRVNIRYEDLILIKE